MRLASIVSFVSLAGCGIADFDVDQPVPEQAVQGSNLPGVVTLLFPIPVSLDLSSKIQAQTTGPIDSITLDSLKLDITATDEPSGDTDDWSFLSSCDVFVESSKSGSTLPKVKIASVSSPGAVHSLSFVIVDGVNLKPYVEEGSTVDSTGMGTAPPDDVSYAGSATFTVHPI